MNKYGNLTSEIIEKFKEIISSDFVFLDEETLQAYGKDHTEDLVFPPNVVLKPKTTQEISEIMKIAFENHIPVTPIGARTGLSGGMLSIHKGIGLSLERMNQILKIDTDNLQVITEPGVITQVLQDAVLEKGLFYPVDPSSKGSCFIGGNIAENSGGARAVKYGVTKDYVLNLEVVLPNGEIIQTGANTLKNSTGYNLTQLMVGSEGTLGVVTKIVLKLLPKNDFNVLMLVSFYDMNEAAKAVSEIFKAGIVPSALEFMERDAIDWTLKFTDAIEIGLKEGIQAHLLIEVDGNYQEILFSQAEKIMQVVEQFKIDEVFYAETEDEKNALWKLRRNVAEAVKSNTIYKEEDTVVPRYELPNLLKNVKEVGEKYGFKSICYGHAGDGNLHVNIIKGSLTEEQWKTEVPKGIKDIFEKTIALGGTLSGEHGIGFVQKNYMPLAFSAVEMQLMKNIKNVFDTNGIMNPGKIFPEHLI